MSSRNSKSSSISNTSNVKSNKYMSSTSKYVIKLGFYVLLLAYLIKLENKSCNCIRDWRHDFLKYFSIAMIFWASIIYALSIKLKDNSNSLINVMRIIMLVSMFISIWCVYTYIGDLDKTKCLCSLEKQKDMHYFLYIGRYIPVWLIIFALLTILIDTITKM